MVAAKNKLNALLNPQAVYGERITVNEVLDSEMMFYPLSRLDMSSPADGGIVMVLASEEKAKALTDKPIWIRGIGWCLDTMYVGQRDLYYPKYVEYAARMAYDMAGIKEPSKEINIAEPYDPFDYKELYHLEGLLLCGKGEAAKLTADGVTQRTGNLPTCPV